MRKSAATLAITAAALLFLFTLASYALEREPIEEVSIDDLANETQISIASDGRSMDLVWWIPFEYWEASFARDKTLPNGVRTALRDALSPHFLVAVAQAEISGLGAFDFYTEQEVRKTLRVTLKGEDGRRHNLGHLQEVPADLSLLLEQLKPILRGAMGRLGNNMHFFVFSDRDPAGKRLADPYGTGTLMFGLERRDGKEIEAQLELPLNALYAPRLCPHGKEAHVSWNFCPWTGEKLPD